MNHATSTRPLANQEEPLVISETENGWRVYAPSDPRQQFLVTGSADVPQCTCAEFQANAHTGEYCAHVQAVLHQLHGTSSGPLATYDQAERNAIQNEPPAPRRRKTTTNGNGNGHGSGTQMVLKRSVSPDGRIDSLSIEFSAPIEQLTIDSIQSQADHMLLVQSGIVSRFLGPNRQRNGNGASTPPPVRREQGAPPTGNNNAVPARLVDVGGMDGRWGRRLFVTVDIGGRTSKLFGSADQLRQHIETAGYVAPQPLTEGTILNIPCGVTTQPSPDGRYTNVAQVLPPLSAPPLRAVRRD